MSDLAFGQPVRLDAVVERCVIDQGGVRRVNPRGTAGRYGDALPFYCDGWPGEPIRLEDDDEKFMHEPDLPPSDLWAQLKDAPVRWRRIVAVYDTGEPVRPVGLVVAHVSRQDGAIVAGGDGPATWHHDRSIPLVEVVVRPDWLHGPARLVLALERDVAALAPAPDWNLT